MYFNSHLRCPLSQWKRDGVPAPTHGGEGESKRQSAALPKTLISRRGLCPIAYQKVGTE